MTVHLILGTAGHIDHGKTSLIRVLTGTDTDRLPEEKKRGITIELGFAELDLGEYRLGIVDVPGHERFVRQMLAGATSMDMALLVVAADDSVKPQTREHLEVLRLLDLPAGVIALTKCDLPDQDWIELVEEEVRELVHDTFLRDAPIVRTSAPTGMGLDELKQALADAAQKSYAARGDSRRDAPLRMAVDRSFTISGHGTVVTGSVSSGTASVGDQLVLEPGGIEVRVRGVQNHDRAAESVHAGQRAAINLVGVRHDEVRRGHELCAPGFLTPSQLLTAHIEVVATIAKPLKHRSRVRLHVGTNETMASVVLLQAKEIAPGGSGIAQLFLSEPVATSWNQAFVLRSESPMLTIGGGRILVPAADKLKHASSAAMSALEDLQHAEPTQRAAAAIYFAGTHPWSVSQLARLAGVENPDDVKSKLLSTGELVEIHVSSQRKLFWHRDVLAEMVSRIEQVLGKMHDREPLRSTLDVSRLANHLSYCMDAATLDYVLMRMAKDKRVRLSERRVGLAERGPQLSRAEATLLAELIEKFRLAGVQPPTVKECEAATAKNKASVPSLISLAETEGDLVQVSSEFYLHRDVEQAMRDRIRAAITADGGLSLSQIREMLGTTRKYAVPICEYLDRIGFTKRVGDLRELG